MSYQARITYPLLIVTGRSGACGKMNLTATGRLSSSTMGTKSWPSAPRPCSQMMLCCGCLPDSRIIGGGLLGILFILEKTIRVPIAVFSNRRTKPDLRLHVESSGRDEHTSAHLSCRIDCLVRKKCRAEAPQGRSAHR